jgi:hypothetical protein
MMSANLLIGDKVSVLIAIANAPGNDEITGEQTHVFKAALPHVDRAICIYRADRVESRADLIPLSLVSR